jgi:hypothetical protein
MPFLPEASFCLRLLPDTEAAPTLGDSLTLSPSRHIQKVAVVKKREEEEERKEKIR